MPFEHADSAFGIVTAAGPSGAAGVAERMPLGPLVLSSPLVYLCAHVGLA